MNPLRIGDRFLPWVAGALALHAVLGYLLSGERVITPPEFPAPPPGEMTITLVEPDPPKPEPPVPEPPKAEPPVREPPKAEPPVPEPPEPELPKSEPPKPPPPQTDDAEAGRNPDAPALFDAHRARQSADSLRSEAHLSRRSAARRLDRNSPPQTCDFFERSRRCRQCRKEQRASLSRPGCGFGDEAVAILSRARQLGKGCARSDDRPGSVSSR